jgi:hypothetical protein
LVGDVLSLGMLMLRPKHTSNDVCEDAPHNVRPVPCPKHELLLDDLPAKTAMVQ